MTENEMLKREIELLKELVKAKDELIVQLKLRNIQSIVIPSLSGHSIGKTIAQESPPWPTLNNEYKFNPGPQSTHPNYGGITLCQGSTPEPNRG